VTGLLKQVNGVWQAVEHYTYTPYGVVTYRDRLWVETGSSANANTTLYTGRLLDTITGLYYYRARFYDASLERFVNRDPIGYRGGINLYEYVRDNPVRRTDPSGQDGNDGKPYFGGGMCGHDGKPITRVRSCGSITLYNNRHPGNVLTGSAAGGDLRCGALAVGGDHIFAMFDDPVIMDKNGVVVDNGMSGDGLLPAIDYAKSHNCCISHVNINDHGTNNIQWIGNRKLSCEQFKPLCDRLCDNATVKLFGCHTGQPDFLVKALKACCSKIKSITACPGGVIQNSTPDPNGPNGCSNRIPPSCEGGWKTW
jgi:RHS repeat-associated protein